MNNTLLLDVQSKDISIALMENNTLVEFSKEPRDMSFSVGDIFLAKVKKNYAWIKCHVRRCRI